MLQERLAAVAAFEGRTFYDVVRWARNSASCLTASLILAMAAACVAASTFPAMRTPLVNLLFRLDTQASGDLVRDRADLLATFCITLYREPFQRGGDPDRADHHALPVANL